MAHPYKSKADSSAKSKKSSITTVANSGAKSPYKKIDGSSSAMQHEKQSAAPGMATGGRISYPLKKGGSDSGVGRLEKSKGYK